MSNLRNSFNKKEILKAENPDKMIGIVENIIDLNKERKGTKSPLDSK